MEPKVWISFSIDFIVTAGTAYLAMAEQGQINNLNQALIPIIGGLVAASKGLTTYYATHPSKIEKDDPRYHDKDTD